MNSAPASGQQHFAAIPLCGYYWSAYLCVDGLFLCGITAAGIGILYRSVTTALFDGKPDTDSDAMATLTEMNGTIPQMSAEAAGIAGSVLSSTAIMPAVPGCDAMTAHFIVW